MRTRSRKASWAAAVVIAAGVVPAHAESPRPDSDSFFTDLDKLDRDVRSLSADLDASQARLGVDRAEAKSGDARTFTRTAAAMTPAIAPGKAARLSVDTLLQKAVAKPVAPASKSADDLIVEDHPAISQEATKKSETSVDPEPDEAIKAPVPAPSHDPLDAPKAVSAPKAGAAGTPEAEPTKGDAAKSDAAKTDATKTDAAKPAAADPAVPTAAPAKTEEPLPPLDAAIKAVLDKRDAADLRGPQATERKKEREAIAFFYAAHGFAPVWSENGAPVAAVDPILARLTHASDDGLSLPTPPPTLKTKGTDAEIAESEIALTEAVVAYARQATGSRVAPQTISPLIGARPELADPAEVIDMMAAAGAQAGTKLQALNPTDPRYAALREKLMELHAAHAPAAETAIPPGPALKVGMRDPRVPLIRSRFSLGASVDDDADALKYDTEVAAAVADFQRENGLPPSGVLTKRTIAALSGGQPSRLEGTLVANMEMWRWMPRDLGHDRIEVNVPDYVVTVYKDNAAVATNKVVVGKTETPTPLFSNTMKYLIVNPTWNVPQSIIKKEWNGNAPRGFDVTYVHGMMMAKQPAGAKNALGRIKFMFPNDYSVYLHDTPSKALFSTSRRAYSHGCVRVDQPFDFAEAVLNNALPEVGKMIWSKKRLTAMLGDKERYVNLPQPLPIHIEYFTASVDTDSGRLKLRDDIYDYTRKVAAALGQDG